MPNRKGLRAYRLGLEAYYHNNQRALAAKYFLAAYQAGIIQGGIYHLKIQLEKYTEEKLTFEECQAIFRAQQKKMQSPFHLDSQWLHQLKEKASLFRQSRDTGEHRKKALMEALTQPCVE